jgi:hypothetical protein
MRARASKASTRGPTRPTILRLVLSIALGLVIWGRFPGPHSVRETTRDFPFALALFTSAFRTPIMEIPSTWLLLPLRNNRIADEGVKKAWPGAGTGTPFGCPATRASKPSTCQIEFYGLYWSRSRYLDRLMSVWGVLSRTGRLKRPRPGSLGSLREDASGSPSPYGIDTSDVGADAAYLESGIETIAAEKGPRVSDEALANFVADLDTASKTGLPGRALLRKPGKR